MKTTSSLTKISLAAGLLAALFSAALTGNAAPAARSGAEVWADNCQSCHGEDGKSNTKVGKKLGLADLTSAESRKNFDAERIFKAIKEGTKDKDGKQRKKPMGDKMTDEEIRLAIEHVKNLK